MYLDAYGFPTTSDGDANDQLCSSGLIVAGQAMGGDLSQIPLQCFAGTALAFGLQPSPGVYTRHVASDPRNVSADQLIPVMIAWAARRDEGQLLTMTLRMIERFGFAQNWVRLDGTRNVLPDFMVLRALPIITRAHWILYPLCLIFDPLLILGAMIGNIVFHDDKWIPRWRGYDDVDTRVFIATLLLCRKVMPTPWSWLAWKVNRFMTPRNYGNFLMGEKDPVLGQLMWYHRVTFRSPGEPANNVEIALLYIPIVEEYS